MPAQIAPSKLMGRGIVTLAGIARMTTVCLDAAERLADEGIEADVIDLLSLSPLDEDAILESVRHTKHLVVVDEDTPRCSVARDIAAIVADRAVDHLDGPVKTVNGADTPVPFSAALLAAFAPDVEAVVAAAVATLRE